MEFINGRFHILSDGIINREEYGLLFENEEKKHYIPVEVTDQINIYGNVTLISRISEYISQINCADTVNDMMLIEAKARQLYYMTFKKA